MINVAFKGIVQSLDENQDPLDPQPLDSLKHEYPQSYAGDL